MSLGEGELALDRNSENSVTIRRLQFTAEWDLDHEVNWNMECLKFTANI